MKRRKHQFHCTRCGSGCEIYKKGKGHRVLICPKCGILATNPAPMLAAIGAALAPTAIDYVSKKFSGKKKEDAPGSQKIEYVDRYTAEERVRDALRC